MTNRRRKCHAMVLLLAAAGLVPASGWLRAQEPNPTETQSGTQNPVQLNNGEPLYKIEVVARDISAVNYFHRNGETKIGFRGTQLMPTAKGKAEVKAEGGRTRIELHV